MITRLNQLEDELMAMQSDKIKQLFLKEQIGRLIEISDIKRNIILKQAQLIDSLENGIRELEASARMEMPEAEEVEEKEEKPVPQPQAPIVQQQPIIRPIQTRKKIMDVRQLSDGQLITASEMYEKGSTIPEIRDYFNMYSDAIARKAVNNGNDLRKSTITQTKKVDTQKEKPSAQPKKSNNIE